MLGDQLEDVIIPTLAEGVSPTPDPEGLDSVPKCRPAHFCTKDKPHPYNESVLVSRKKNKYLNNCEWMPLSFVVLANVAMVDPAWPWTFKRAV